MVPFESGYRGVNSSCYVTHKTPAYGTPPLPFHPSSSCVVFTSLLHPYLQLRLGYWRGIFMSRRYTELGRSPRESLSLFLSLAPSTDICHGNGTPLRFLIDESRDVTVRSARFPPDLVSLERETRDGKSVWPTEIFTSDSLSLTRCRELVTRYERFARIRITRTASAPKFLSVNLYD